MQKVIFTSPLPDMMYKDYTNLSSMISNCDLTETHELLILFWAALVLVTKIARAHQGFVISVFALHGFPTQVQSLFFRRGGTEGSKNRFWLCQGVIRYPRICFQVRLSTPLFTPVALFSPPHD